MSTPPNSPEAQKIQRLKNLASEVDEVHPLLERLLPKLPGVERVENTHGTLEHGADFVISKTDLTVELPSYCGVIVKLGNINKSEAHRVIEQARECHGERFFLGGKQKITLSEIWVLTTGTVAAHAKQLVHEQFASSKLHFVERDHLIRLIDKYLISYWTDVNVHIGDYLSQERKKIEAEDRELSLIPQLDEPFYIPHEVVRLRSRDRVAAKQRQNQIGRNTK